MKKSLVLGFLVAVCGVTASESRASALSAERDTPARLNQYTSLTVASNVIIYAGSLVCVDSNGKANPAADTSGFAVVGRAEATADNRGTLYSATKIIKVARGTFQWANGDAIAAADIGKIVYVTDDQTVNKTGGGQNIIAGAVVDVDSAGVWVDTAKIGPIGAATPASLAVAGAATVGTTLGVTGATTLTGALTANGGVNCDSGKFVVSDTSGNTAIAGTLIVTGASSFTGSVTAASTVAASGFKIGAVSGYSGAITNISTLSTNIMQYAGGVLTNSVNVP